MRALVSVLRSPCLAHGRRIGPIVVTFVIFALSGQANAASLPGTTHAGAQLEATPASCPGNLPPHLEIGKTGRVILGNSVNVRDKPDAQKSQVLDTLQGGDGFVVLSGPRCATGFTWWKIDIGGVVGWAIESAGEHYLLEPGPLAITPRNAAQVKQVAVLREEIKDQFVTGVAFSPDGKYVASGHHHAVQVWDVPGGQLKMTLVGHTDLVWSVAFSPDGQRVAFVDQEGSVWLGAVQHGPIRTRFDGRRRWLTSCIAFSPDGRLLAVGGWDDGGIVHLWDVQRGQIAATLRAQFLAVESAAFSPDGTLLVTGGQDGSVRLWGLLSGR